MVSSSSVVIRVSETTRGAAGKATVAWSVTIAAAIFAERANLGRQFFELLAVVATFLLGAYLGWNRRMGVVFLAPLISWMFAWFPLIVGEMVRDGVLKGFCFGVLFATIGWIVIGGAQFVALFAVALPFRLLTSKVHHDAKLTVEGPFDFR